MSNNCATVNLVALSERINAKRTQDWMLLTLYMGGQGILFSINISEI
jgi:hypothetical protein